MTTKVTIEANHGWPVDVNFIGQHSAQSSERVAAGEKRYFYVHSGQDILVHEVQPGTDGIAKREGLDLRHGAADAAGRRSHRAQGLERQGYVARVRRLRTSAGPSRRSE